MWLLHSIYYLASAGYPSAVPAGILATDLGDTADLTTDVKEVVSEITSLGLHDDSSYLLGFTNDDCDLVRRDEGDTFSYVVSNQIVPAYQWELIKQQHGLRFYEQSLESCFCCDEEDLTV